MARPTVRLALSHPAHFLALGLGSGLSPVAPGTIASFVAWGVFCLIASRFTDLSFAIFLAVCFFAGGLICDRTGRALGVVDHGAIVWDEFVAVWLVLWLVPATWLWQFAGVVVFRFFDIVKPWPIRQADARFKNGMGVMLDDLLAAGYSLVVLAIAWRVLM